MSLSLSVHQTLMAIKMDGIGYHKDVYSNSRPGQNVIDKFKTNKKGLNLTLFLVTESCCYDFIKSNQ